MWHPVFVDKHLSGPYLAVRVNQYQWTFLDNAARRHTLGIAHSANSGHLVVHCNQQIVKIDFSVLEPKVFSFFVEEELCHLAIEGDKQTGFTYKFHIDTEVDTPVNRDRKIKRITSARRNALTLTAMVTTISVLLGSVAWWGWSTSQEKLQDKLILSGIPTEARLVDGTSFEFIAGNKVVNGEPLGTDRARLRALGATATDRVPVRYYESSGSKFVVDWRVIFRNIQDPLAPSSAAAALLISGLEGKLPPAAGSPICALRAAAKTGSFRNQLSLMDAYLLDVKPLRQRWDATTAHAAYQATLREVCPGPEE